MPTYLFRTNYSLINIFLPLGDFRRDTGAVWYVRLVTLNVAIPKTDYNPSALAAAPLPKSITATTAMPCGKVTEFLNPGNLFRISLLGEDILMILKRLTYTQD